jgi:hypothetical protein
MSFSPKRVGAIQEMKWRDSDQPTVAAKQKKSHLRVKYQQHAMHQRAASVSLAESASRMLAARSVRQ